MAVENEINVEIDSIFLETESIKSKYRAEFADVEDEDLIDQRIALVDLRNCRVTKKTWTAIASLDYCQRLFVGNVDLNEDAVATIGGLHDLAFLHMQGTTIVEYGRMSISKMLPTCQIIDVWIPNFNATGSAGASPSLDVAVPGFRPSGIGVGEFTAN